jgi:hypothetical protein
MLERIFFQKSEKSKNGYFKICEEIKSVKSEIEVAISNFNNALDSDMLDVYIYKIKSAQARYQSLLKSAKKISNQS